MRKIAVLAVLLGVLSFGTARASFDANIRYGTKGSDAVKEVQEFLTDQGVYTGPITGNFFTLTLKSVKAFQKVQGLAVNGYWGSETRSKAQDLTKDDEQVAGEASFNQENIPLSGNEPALSFGDGKSYNFNGKLIESNAVVTPDISPKATDWCDNILGNQSILPPGYFRSEDNNCYPKPAEVVQSPVVEAPAVTQPIADEVCKASVAELNKQILDIQTKLNSDIQALYGQGRGWTTDYVEARRSKLTDVAFLQVQALKLEIEGKLCAN